jgi:hypothetical protein
MSRRRYQLDEEAGVWLDIEPFAPHQPDEAHRRDRRMKGYMAFLGIPVALISGLVMPFMIGYWLGLLGVILGLVWSVLMIPYAIIMFGVGKFIFYDTKPIPPDLIHLPPPIKIRSDEEWRKPTSVRYLEELKISIEEIEERSVSRYKEMQKAFANIVFPSSYSEYDAAMALATSYKKFSRKYELLKESANRLFAGEVVAEINELEARIKQLQLERQSLVGDFTSSQNRVQSTQGNWLANALAGASSDQIKRNIKDIDAEILKLKSNISELNKIDLNLIKIKPQLTAASQRERIAKLRRDKKAELKAMKAAKESKEDIRRRANMLDNAIEQAEEKLQELL